MTNSNPYHVFMLPDLEAYVQGVKFKNKLKKWSKAQGFRELSPENLKEWCLDSFVMDSLLKMNQFHTSPFNSPVSPMTPEICVSAWDVPPCRGNLLDDYKLSTGYLPSTNSECEQLKHTRIKRIWRRVTRHKNEHDKSSDFYQASTLAPTRSLVLTDSRTNKYSSIPCHLNTQGSTNVLRLLELI